MNTLELRDKINHFFAVNQININEIKYLIGTIFLFVSVGGIHTMFMNYIKLKNNLLKIIYYLSLIIIGSILYLKMI